jgi:chromosome segregation ATPase
MPTLTRANSSLSQNTPSPAKERELEMQIQELQELLTDCEFEISRLKDQEQMLKEEVRRLDRIENRGDLRHEYVKNVVLSFFESQDRQVCTHISHHWFFCLFP